MMFRTTTASCRQTAYIRFASIWRLALHVIFVLGCTGQSPKTVLAQTADAIARPADFSAEVIAGEHLIANPVGFCFDEHGRIFVAETFRQLRGVEDIRNHMDWLVDDLAAQTVEDRVAYLEKFYDGDLSFFTQETDRIRLLSDADGDGIYDTDSIFAEGFADVADGTGADVAAWNGDLYYTCIPHLWKLRDTDGDGKAEECEALHSGYGVRFGFRGHDLHGLEVGPDGRLYFSIGDRGINVKTKEGEQLVVTDRGSVFPLRAGWLQLGGVR